MSLFSLSEENRKYLKEVAPPRDRFTDCVTGFLTEGYDEIENHIKLEEIPEYLKFLKKWLEPQKIKPDDGKYRYLVTFTLREEPTKEQEDEIEEYIKKQFKRKALKVEEAYIAKEYTKRGRAHFHVSVCTLKYLAKDRFQYYIKKYGFVDIDKSRSQTLKNSFKYISKDTMPTKI